MADKKKKSRRERFLAEHPTCYFCNGLRPPTTIDHVPPQACFPAGYMPENFEFAACYPCNQWSRDQDKVFGFWAMALDFDPAKAARTVDRERKVQLGKEIAKDRPHDIEAIERALPVWAAGEIVTPHPVAFQMDTPRALSAAAEVMSIKLTHALYYRETKNCLASSHRFAGAMYQPQDPAFEYFTSFITSLLSKISRGGRTNIKNYGDRFGYRCEYKDDDDFFVYLAQFGHGLTAWGIVCSPQVDLPADGPLAKMQWRPGAWGAKDASPDDQPRENTKPDTEVKSEGDWLSSSDSSDHSLPPEFERLMFSHEPSALGDRIARDLDNYSVAFITSNNGALAPAGSGTLVSFRGGKFVLTAGHVWHGDGRSDSGLKNADAIQIPLKEGEPKRLLIVPADIVAFGPEIPEAWNQWGPDLIMLRLPPDRIGSFEAVGRSFYNLSRAAKTNPQCTDTLFLVGAPAKRGNFEGGKAIPEMQAMLLWKATGPYMRTSAPHPTRQDFDYIDVGINTNAPFVARTFKGVSGGGLWRVCIHRSEAGDFDSTRTLIGVAYWQEPYEETELLMVRCHGSRAIETVLRLLPEQAST